MKKIFKIIGVELLALLLVAMPSIASDSWSDWKAEAKKELDKNNPQRASQILYAAETTNKTLSRSDKGYSALLLQIGIHLRQKELFEEAQLAFQKAAIAGVNSSGSFNNDTIRALNELILVARTRRDFIVLERSYKQLIVILEHNGSDGTSVSNIRRNLAECLIEQSKYVEAEILCRKILDRDRVKCGPNSQLTAIDLTNLATCLLKQKKYDDVEQIYNRILVQKLSSKEPLTPYMGDSLENLAQMYRTLKRFDKEEKLYKQIVAIDESANGINDLHLPIALANLARAYSSKGKNEMAESVYIRLLKIRDLDSSFEAKMFDQYVALLHKMNKEEEIAKITKTYQAMHSRTRTRKFNQDMPWLKPPSL